MELQGGHKRRRCPRCEPNIYRSRQVAKILRMGEALGGSPPLGEEVLSTAPGGVVLPDSPAIARWNDREPEMWKRFIRLMKKRYPLFESVGKFLRDPGARCAHVLGGNGAPCFSEFRIALKPGDENINRNNMVAPTGFEPVFPDRSTLLPQNPLLAGVATDDRGGEGNLLAPGEAGGGGVPVCLGGGR